MNSRAFRSVWALAVILHCHSTRISHGQEISAGPFYHRGPLTLESGTLTEIFGPLFSHETKESERRLTLSPIFMHRQDTVADSSELSIAYPLFSQKRFGAEHRSHVLQLFSWAGGERTQGGSSSRVTIFPFYFQQRSTDSNLNYTALVPFYGRLKNRLFRDEVHFALLPLYLQSRKKDVITDNYLFPFFHRRSGPNLTGWQLWPLLGAEHKGVTTRTNILGDAETVGGYEKAFALWPFYFNNRLGIGTENQETQRVVLPLFSSQRSPKRDSTTWVWPLGFTYTQDREKKYREWDAPWPLVVFARGEGKTVNRIWPLFGKARNATLESDFFLGPLYKYNRANASPLDRQRTRILYFLYSDLVERNLTTETALERTDLWPLFTARRDHNGNERLQLFSLLEPLLPISQTVERLYSPLWSVWRSEKNAATGASSQSLLWNLYRRDTTPTTKKCSLLFGLFHYQSGPEGSQVRVFYMPMKKNSRKPASQANGQADSTYVSKHR